LVLVFGAMPNVASQPALSFGVAEIRRASAHEPVQRLLGGVERVPW
jgi:hypothetical protein